MYPQIFLCFLQKKECSLNLLFSLGKKAKRNAFQNFCLGKEKGHEFDFSFPGRSKDNEIS